MEEHAGRLRALLRPLVLPVHGRQAVGAAGKGARLPLLGVNCEERVCDTVMIASIEQFQVMI